MSGKDTKTTTGTMPLTPTNVDIEARKRMEEGMLVKTGRNIAGDDIEWAAFMRLCTLAGSDPVFNTYLECDEAIQKEFTKWRRRVLGGDKPA